VNKLFLILLCGIAFAKGGNSKNAYAGNMSFGQIQNYIEKKTSLMHRILHEDNAGIREEEDVVLSQSTLILLAEVDANTDWSSSKKIYEKLTVLHFAFTDNSDGDDSD
jgi:hypothetical protein